MTQPRWTEGSWKRSSEEPGDEYAACVIAEQSGRTVFLARCESQGDFDETEANARLFAASKDLYEATEYLMSPDPTDQKIGREKALAAQRKARGE